MGNPAAKTAQINVFRGLNERRILGVDPRETSSLLNVDIRDGKVIGRKGINEFDNITTAASAAIIGLWEFIRVASSSNNLVRMTRTKLENWNGSSWDDVTGTALNGLAYTRPQACTHGEDDMLCFITEGEDRPRKYTGSGTSATLGGTPPYAKAIASYVGFLALGNISDDGTTFRPLELILSDDPDGTWEDCNEQDLFVTTMIMNESPGPILALGVLGRSLFVYKSDAVIQVTFTGGPTRFNRTKMPFPMGILAPLSLQSLGEKGHIFLAQDRNLYINNGNSITELPPNVQKTLRETMDVDWAPYCRSAVNADNDTYELVHAVGSVTYMPHRLSYNYQTGEFSKHLYPVEFSALSNYRFNDDNANVLVGSSSTLVYEFDTGTDDNGTAISRYFDIDWTQMGNSGNKHFLGGEFVFEKAAGCRVKISMGVDKSSNLIFPKIYSLKAEDPDETEVRINYQIPTPVYGSWFRWRVQMYHDGATNQAKMLSFEPEFIPLHSVAQDTPSKPAQADKS